MRLKGMSEMIGKLGILNGNTTDYFYERLKFGIVGSIYHNQVGGESG